VRREHWLIEGRLHSSSRLGWADAVEQQVPPRRAAPDFLWRAALSVGFMRLTLLTESHTWPLLRAAKQGNPGARSGW